MGRKHVELLLIMQLKQWFVDFLLQCPGNQHSANLRNRKNPSKWRTRNCTDTRIQQPHSISDLIPMSLLRPISISRPDSRIPTDNGISIRTARIKYFNRPKNQSSIMYRTATIEGNVLAMTSCDLNRRSRKTRHLLQDDGGLSCCYNNRNVASALSRGRFTHAVHWDWQFPSQDKIERQLIGERPLSRGEWSGRSPWY